MNLIKSAQEIIDKGEYVLVSKADLQEVERIRLALWKEYGGEANDIHATIKLQNTADGLWEIANRKHPKANPILKDYLAVKKRLVELEKAIETMYGV